MYFLVVGGGRVAFNDTISIRADAVVNPHPNPLPVGEGDKSAETSSSTSATSADGYIARPDGDLKWLTSRPKPEGFYGMSAFMRWHWFSLFVARASCA
jgi:hypothetical protein